MFLIKVLLTALLWVSLFMAGIIPFHALEQHLVTLEQQQQQRGPVVVEERIRRPRRLLRGDDDSSSSFSSPFLEGRLRRRTAAKEQHYSAPLDDHADHHVQGRLEGEPSTARTSTTTTTGRIWTQIAFSVEYDETLITHTIQHYLNLGLLPEYFLIGLHHNERNSDSPSARIAERLQLEYGIQHIHEWYGNFTSQENWNQKVQQRQEAHVQDCDWIVKVDADELVRSIPYGNFPRFLQTLEANHHDVVYGTMVDRVSSTGDLLEISNTTLIQDQFPLECHITQAAQANTTKVVAFRGYLTEFRAGHGLVYGQVSCPYLEHLVLDHYKWHASVVTKLEERITHYQWLEGQGQGHHWWRESETFLKHLSDHDYNNRDGSTISYRINIHDPEFQCQEETTSSSSR